MMGPSWLNSVTELVTKLKNTDIDTSISQDYIVYVNRSNKYLVAQGSAH